jgi:hypothetical protein
MLRPAAASRPHGPRATSHLPVDLHQRQCQAVGQHGAVRERKIGKAQAEQEVAPVRDRLLVAHLDLDTCGQLAEIRAHAVGARKELVEPNFMASLVYSTAIWSASPELKVCCPAGGGLL